MKLFARFSKGELLKILHQRDPDVAVRKQNLIAAYRLPKRNRINAMTVLPNEYLFVADDNGVYQFRLGQCALHADCDSCASDPYCSWNIARSECFAQETAHSTAVGWITDSSAVEKCRTYLQSVSRTLYPGDGAILRCPTEDVNSLEWRLDRQPVGFDFENVVLATNGDLVLVNVSATVTK